MVTEPLHGEHIQLELPYLHLLKVESIAFIFLRLSYSVCKSVGDVCVCVMINIDTRSSYGIRMHTRYSFYGIIFSFIKQSEKISVNCLSIIIN